MLPVPQPLNDSLYPVQRCLVHRDSVLQRQHPKEGLAGGTDCLYVGGALLWNQVVTRQPGPQLLGFSLKEGQYLLIVQLPAPPR